MAGELGHAERAGAGRVFPHDRPAHVGAIGKVQRRHGGDGWLGRVAAQSEKHDRDQRPAASITAAKPISQICKRAESGIAGHHAQQIEDDEQVEDAGAGVGGLAGAGMEATVQISSTSSTTSSA